MQVRSAVNLLLAATLFVLLVGRGTCVLELLSELSSWALASEDLARPD